MQNSSTTPDIDANRNYSEDYNVYTLDDDECVAKMIEKILE